MEDHQGQQHEAKSEKSEAVRSRWTPKPEQILILESIFNSGMVNPPKDETVRIRKLLEKFGTVGDANVFYWFQNRRSRSRRRQRQLMQQAAAAAAVAATTNRHPQPQPQPQPQAQAQAQVLVGGGAIPHDHDHTQTTHHQVNFVGSESVGSNWGFGSSPSYDIFGSSSSSRVGAQQGMESFFSVSSPQMVFPDVIDHASSASSLLYPPLDPNLSYQTAYGGPNISGFITVFINGIATELPKGPIDFKSVFGNDVMIIHSSGIPVPINEFGFLMQSLQHGDGTGRASLQLTQRIPKPTSGPLGPPSVAYHSLFSSTAPVFEMGYRGSFMATSAYSCPPFSAQMHHHHRKIRIPNLLDGEPVAPVRDPGVLAGEGDMRVGKHITRDLFTVGGYHWAIYFYLDGFINLSEFAAFCRFDTVDGGDTELRDTFNLYDQDNNGLISELYQVLNRLGMKCFVDECHNMIKSVDSDSNDNVNFPEFKRMMSNNRSNSNSGKLEID
ncbi:hypothetical protein Fmac_029500 [Flemingia macrophylla]|uniref:Homeobox domain-containing protein n=1 Tax=Flemingia macrophylla TaxID=520843 RepID=A0ABD1LAI0_9FABA